MFDVLNELKDCDVEINYEYTIKNFSSQMKKANKLNAARVLILGEDEYKNNSVSIKDFETGLQKTVKLNELKGEL